MKKNYSFKAFFLMLALVISYGLQGQIIFTSTPDSIAVLNEVYSYDVNATYAPDAPVYSLQTAPAWMSINSSSGLITGTPTLMTMGGQVIVKAVNSNGSFTHTFYIYISNEIVCDPEIIAYWPMDNKVVHMLPDIANSHDANWNGPTQPEPVISSNAVAGNSLLFAPTNVSDEFYYVADQEPFQFQYDDNFSVSFWFKNTPSAYTTGYYGEILMGRNNGIAKWYIRWDDTTEKLEFFMQDNSGDDTLVVHPTVIDDTLWHHVVATFNSVKATGQESYLHLWVDKVKRVLPFDFYTDNFYGTGFFNLGWLDNFGRSYSGYLDEVVYYHMELLQAEVYSLYNKGAAHQAICAPGSIAPIITSLPVTTATEDAAYSYTLTYRKADINPVTLSAPTLPAWLSFNASTGVLSGTPDNSNVGSHSVKLSLSNGTITIDQSFAVAVANVNDLPVITSAVPGTSVDEDVAYSYTLTATDVDAGATLTFSAPVLPAWMSFNTTTGVLSGTPTNDQVGTAASADFNVTLRVTDNTGAFVELPFTLTVVQVNDAPVVNSQNAIATDEDVAYTVLPTDLNVTDVDNIYPDDFALTVKAGSKYTFSGNTITPDENYNGTLTVPVDLSDGEATVSFNLSVTVNAVNDAPVFTSTPVTAGQTATSYEYWISSTDVEAQALTLTCTTKPAWLTFTSNSGNGLLTGTPSNPGSYPVILSVTDGTAAVEQTFSIVVTGESAIDDEETALTRVYPNPADDYVEFRFREISGAANLKIISIDGRLMKEVNLDNQSSYTLDVSNLRSGEYFFRIVSDRGEQFGKLIIR